MLSKDNLFMVFFLPLTRLFPLLGMFVLSYLILQSLFFLKTQLKAFAFPEAQCVLHEGQGVFP